MQGDQDLIEAAAGDAKVLTYLRFMDDSGWGRFIVGKRCHDERRVFALAEIGLVSSATAPIQERGDWKLNLTHLGMDLRKALLRLGREEDCDV
ncbi:hypothetical protein [Rhodovarius lipocyclicus]|uniref:hypothetical protein n=1 Tax=Rhodovarius lipocyclicus TaxID=268410 RepID=UPI00135A2932|nr:hypothetical protein [Rhodovarius lipocyclicus]